MRLSILVIAISVLVGADESPDCTCVSSTYCTEPHYEEVSSGTCDEDLVCCKRVDWNQPSCGYFTTNPSNIGARISDSPIELIQNEVPWMTIITDASKKTLGSGTLIHPGVVLTTASVVYGKQEADIAVQVNALNRNIPVESESYFRKVHKIITHQKYNDTYLSNNIALLILTNPIQINDEVRVLCLPNQGQRFDGKLCWFAGWDNEKPEAERSLAKTQQYVLSKEQCQDDLRTFNNHFPQWLHLHSSFMCTIGDLPAERPSQGDGGAPLFCRIADNSDYYALVGMASWVTPESGPAVYTNVPRFRDWIDDYLGRLHNGVGVHKL